MSRGAADEVTFSATLDGVDWDALKTDLAADRFDNGRTSDQLRASFANSDAVVFARAGDRIVGTARVLSDGICNAYLVDVWTQTPYRRRGIARTMVEKLLERLDGQHVGLFTMDATEFYTRLGFHDEPGGMSRVVGRWLRRES